MVYLCALLSLAVASGNVVAVQNRVDFSEQSALVFSAPLSKKEQANAGSGWKRAAYLSPTGEQFDLLPMETFTSKGGVVFQDSYPPQVSPTGKYAVLDILRSGSVDPGQNGEPHAESKQYCPVLETHTGCIVSAQSGELCGGSWDKNSDAWIVPGYDGDSTKDMLSYQFQSVNVLWREYLAASTKPFRYSIKSALTSNLGPTNLMACEPPAAENREAYEAISRQLKKEGDLTDATYIDDKLGPVGKGDTEPPSSTISVDKARLYDRPDMTAQTRMYLVKGDRVTILDKSVLNWVHIKYVEQNGSIIDKWMQATSLK